MRAISKPIRGRPGKKSGGFRGLGAHLAWVSLTITLILFSIQLFFIRPYFLVNDDIFKILMAKGIGPASVPTPFIGYSNIALGYALEQFFSWFPKVPWYTGLLCLAQGAALGAFLWLLCLGKSHWGKKILLFVGLWIAVYFIFFAYLQFSITAALCAQAGVLLWCLGPESFGQGRSVTVPAAAAAFFLTAFLIRQDSFFLMALVSLPLLLFRLRDRHFRDFVRRQKGWMVLAALGMVILGAIHFSWFYSDPAWKRYEQFDQQRLELQDYRIADYTVESKPFFDSAGWSENDFWLFKNWFFTNPTKFNASRFKELAADFPRIGGAGKTASFHSLGELLASSWDRRILLFFLLFLALCPGVSFRFLLAQFSWVILVLLVLIYGFRAPDRVTLPILVFLMNLAVFYAEQFFDPIAGPGFGGRCRSWAWRTLVPLALALSLGSPWDYHLQSIEKTKAEKEMRTFVEQLGPRDNQLYVVWNFPFELIGAFDDFEIFRRFHMDGLNFSQVCPTQLDTLRRFRLEDPFRDAVDRKDVFLVCTTEQGLRYHEYLEENYRLHIYARPVFECGYFKVFSIHSGKEPGKGKAG